MPTALITGATAGIGRVLADLCAADNHDLVLVARRDMTAIAQQITARFGVKVETHRIDLSEPGAAQRVVDAVGARDIDVLINNAGFSRYGLFIDQPLSATTSMIATNVTTVAELTQLIVPGMVRRGRGRVLQLASTAAFQPGPRMAVYYATKAFVLSFSEALANELHGTGVTVTTLCPGPTRTEFNDVAQFKTTALAETFSADAEPVARAGYAAMKAGERLCIPGATNKLTAVGSQLLPRGLVVRLAAAFTRADD
jgi:short-subunit dehydrogenase